MPLLNVQPPDASAFQPVRSRPFRSGVSVWAAWPVAARGPTVAIAASAATRREHSRLPVIVCIRPVETNEGTLAAGSRQSKSSGGGSPQEPSNQFPDIDLIRLDD